MPDVFAVTSSTEQFRSPIMRIVSDDVVMPGGQTSRRDYMVHIGAVGVAALDDEGRIVLVRQYRHPVRQELWELPAGLLDVHGEAGHATAARELAEEADLKAGRWDVLTDLLTTPGCSDEAIRIYLARDLSPTDETFDRVGEEALMSVRRVPLDEAVSWVFAGQIRNAAACVGVLAAARARDNGFTGLRPATADWTDRPGH
ncbi:NUDIX domain-containing protein [Fodinicola acaciae]|uniref:NUDIX domain-containing protein n=1 Tax=Fodinicola acaciae TaxID=2681555 RepID=UPI001FEACA09|nr:NUDIX hydrolase [Fodinicola acaciae]